MNIFKQIKQSFWLLVPLLLCGAAFGKNCVGGPAGLYGDQWNATTTVASSGQVLVGVAACLQYFPDHC